MIAINYTNTIMIRFILYYIYNRFYNTHLIIYFKL